MGTLITNVSVEELTENYGDVSDLGTPTYASNSIYSANGAILFFTSFHSVFIAIYQFIVALLYNILNVFNKCISVSIMLNQYFTAMMYNWFNLIGLLLSEMKLHLLFSFVIIVYLNILQLFINIDVNENYVFLILYIIDTRRQLNVEMFEAINIAVIYFSHCGVNHTVNPFIFSILYFISMDIFPLECDKAVFGICTLMMYGILKCMITLPCMAI